MQQAMRAVRLALGLVLAGPALLATAPAQAESLRCNGAFTEIGDTRLSVLQKCGEPLLRDSFCAPLFYFDAGSAQYVQVPPGIGVPACTPVDEWLYDRGPGNLMATVRFQGGIVRSIRYARSPS